MSPMFSKVATVTKIVQGTPVTKVFQGCTFHQGSAKQPVTQVVHGTPVSKIEQGTHVRFSMVAPVTKIVQGTPVTKVV